MRKILLTSIIILFSTIALIAQSDSTNIIDTKFIQLNEILDQADTLTTAESIGYDEDFNVQIDSTFNINKIISLQLLDILNLPDISDYNLDSLMQHDYLGITHSKDKRLWFFSWYSNNGGSMVIINNILHYRSLSDSSNNSIDLSLEHSPTLYCSKINWVNQIYKLESTNNKDLYLCLSSGRYCSTCCAEIASVIELTTDSINFNYPAFSENDTNYSACYYLESRCGNTKKFIFSPKTQTINYTYLTDDNTAIKRENDEEARTINGILKWNGIKFVETINE
jgi:hypothetical protein